jgi:hypothetical protein
MDRQTGRHFRRAARAAAASIAIGLLLAPPLAHAAFVWSVNGSVSLVRDGVAGKTAVQTRTQLQEADVLRGETKESGVLIQCGKEGDAHTLSGEFEAIVLSSADDGSCVIDLKAGIAVATKAPATKPGGTTLRSGPIAMASIHTQFGIYVTQADGDAGAIRSFVVDGSATCRDSRRPDKVWSLNSGEEIDPQTGARSAIGNQTYEQLARTFAQLDATEMHPRNQVLEDQLAAGWLEVLRKPGDLQARNNLTRLQSFSQSALAQYQKARARELAAKSAAPSLEVR